VQDEVSGLTRVPLQVGPPVDQNPYRRRPGAPHSLRRAQGTIAEVGLDDDKVGPLTQSVSGRVADGLEDGRVPSGDASLAKHLSVLLAYIDQRDVQNEFACHLSGPPNYGRLSRTCLAGLIMRRSTGRIVTPNRAICSANMPFVLAFGENAGLSR